MVLPPNRHFCDGCPEWDGYNCNKEFQDVCEVNY